MVSHGLKVVQDSVHSIPLTTDDGVFWDRCGPTARPVSRLLLVMTSSASAKPTEAHLVEPSSEDLVEPRILGLLKNKILHPRFK